MKTPRYWSRATADDTNRDGRKLSISCWRSSAASQSEAHEFALAAASLAMTNLLRGTPLNRYTYGQLPLREEVLNSINDGQGEAFLAVTRNNYGAVILNTPRVAFIDLDFPENHMGGQLQQLFARWFGSRVPCPDAQRESENLWAEAVSQRTSRVLTDSVAFCPSRHLRIIGSIVARQKRFRALYNVHPIKSHLDQRTISSPLVSS